MKKLSEALVIVTLVAASAACVMTGHPDAAAWFGFLALIALGAL